MDQPPQTSPKRAHFVPKARLLLLAHRPNHAPAMSADDTIHTKSITDTSPSDWRYVSEGGATIVFSYVGPPNPEYTGTVLRLRKSAATMGAYPLGASRSREPSPIRIDDTTDEPDDPMIEYQRKCMERLIPREHLARLESVRLERGWLKDLVAMHDVVRPTTRSVSDHVDLTRKKGVLATDLVGGDWLAVEIKVGAALTRFVSIRY